MERTLAGDTDSFGVLVDRYRHQVYGLCVHYLGDFEAAEDVAQVAFVRAYERLSQLRDRDVFAGWLRNIAANLCRTRLRRRSREVDLNHAVDATVDDESERVAMRTMIRQAIASLPAPTRMTVNLFCIDGLSHQEVGSFLGITTKSVDSRLHRARQHLQKEMMGMVESTYGEHRLTEEFVDEVLHKVTIDEVGAVSIGDSSQAPVRAVLRDASGEAIGIRINRAAAASIATVLSRQRASRPMTHDLFRRLRRAFGIRVSRVVLDRRNRRFSAQATFERRGTPPRTLDVQPGDGLAMALRGRCEVLVTQRAWEGVRRLKPSGAARQAKSAPLPQASKKRRRNPWAIAIDELTESRYFAPTEPFVRAAQETERARRDLVKSWNGSLRAAIVSSTGLDDQQQTLVLLTADDGTRLPIWIAPAETRAIYAYLELHRKRTSRLVDAPPSDSLPLALRVGCPLFVHHKVMEEAGLPPDTELAWEQPPAERPPRGRVIGEGAPALAKLLEQACEHNAQRLQIECSADDEELRCHCQPATGEAVSFCMTTGGLPADLAMELLAHIVGVRGKPYPRTGSSLKAGTTKTVDLRATFEKDGNAVTANVETISARQPAPASSRKQKA